MYNNKTFKSVTNTDNGEVDNETIFHYHQEGSIVWAEYSGGQIRKGFLIAKLLINNELEMRYQHVNQAGELMTGECHSIPEILSDNRIRLHEKWHWTSGDLSSGESVVEEVRVK